MSLCKQQLSLLQFSLLQLQLSLTEGVQTLQRASKVVPVALLPDTPGDGQLPIIPTLPDPVVGLLPGPYGPPCPFIVLFMGQYAPSCA
jgi:hypothetical protein